MEGRLYLSYSALEKFFGCIYDVYGYIMLYLAKNHTEHLNKNGEFYFLVLSADKRWVNNDFIHK